MLFERCLAHADMQIRSDGRTVHGLAVPFDREATVNDGWGPYREVFRQGSFAKTLAERGERVKLLINHDKFARLPIGRPTELREDPAGLVGEFHVSKTRDGDEALELIRDGVLDAFSIGFRGVKERDHEGLTERTEVELTEVSVVAFPAYTDALIAGVRNQIEDWRDFSPEELRRLIALARHLDEDATPPPEAADGTSGDGAGTTATEPASATRGSRMTGPARARVLALLEEKL